MLQARAQLLSGLTTLSCQGLQAPLLTSDVNALFGALPALQACCSGFRHVPESALARLLPLQACSLRTNGLPLPGNDTPSFGLRFPTALLACTQLTSLTVNMEREMDAPVWGGLPDGITALKVKCLVQNVSRKLESRTHLGLQHSFL